MASSLFGRFISISEFLVASSPQPDLINLSKPETYYNWDWVNPFQDKLGRQ